MAAEFETVTAYGIPIRVRPIAPDDRARLAAMFTGLSERSRYLRFHAAKPKLSERELTYLTDIDHRRHEALVALDAQDGSIVGVARYATAPDDSGTADLAVTVADAWQGQGIGTLLGRELLARARENAMHELTAISLPDNGPARRVLIRLGFTLREAGDHIAGRVALGNLSPARSAAHRGRGPRRTPAPGGLPGFAASPPRACPT
jgi:RimJ/RimL family protein N-acetyltransferase